MRRQREGLSLAQQALALRGRFPESEALLAPNALSWRGELQPTPASRRYVVGLRHRPGVLPRVSVISPALETRLGASLPHVYAEGFLCLHRADDWSDRMLLADSIVPWAAEWLYFYEFWLATGQWFGGGEWPPEESAELPEAA